MLRLPAYAVVQRQAGIWTPGVLDIECWDPVVHRVASEFAVPCVSRVVQALNVASCGPRQPRQIVVVVLAAVLALDRPVARVPAGGGRPPGRRARAYAAGVSG